ncbi:ubiquinone biosynthesis accessory factor UbiJ [Propionivibrio dicarboxylicus]|uniref:Ubiquinone biosynthesis accessory factor UbiJ n=1 Tax=Propionivibrio dicarboxylicus TaxID=83767 RepID=A0A1G7W6N3_9RHOO|nr:hypothetical protein [Propionivibrio dicarboxylicus]SDG67647.1 ubiquinone biosynthesis protein UbiJ [Propionivibrio dicarboxylicus]
MLIRTALGFANHLLAGEAWARKRLQPFAGQGLRLICGPVTANLVIRPDGTLTEADTSNVPAVELILPPEALWQSGGDREALIAATRLNGAADLAETIGFVLRHLRWEIEDDLAPVLGDVAARRLAKGAARFIAWHQRQAQAFAQNLAEYFSLEKPLIVQRFEFAAFARDVGQVADATERLNRRVESLTARRNP